jgi:DNA-directed RNA polymerase specialized sigma subunit
MRAIERFLREYWFAQRSIGHMMLDLGAAKAAAQCAAEVDGVAARAMAAQRQAEVKSIARRLAEERTLMARIETALKDARLTEREREYVKLRYFENRSAEAVCQRMYISSATGGRIRAAALKKLSVHNG